MIWLNENNPYAAQWLRNLIAEGCLPHGAVDDRSILAVRAADLGARQCHFFAGIGGWPHALELAGWPADRAVWTASLPCQPLSVAGQRQGALDERHLWPAFHDLVAERRPATIFGEQVASADGREWLAAVRADLESLGYAVGAACLPACGVGAPHLRYRLYWVAHACDAGRQGRLSGRADSPRGTVDRHLGRGGAADRVADADGGRRALERAPWLHEDGPSRDDHARRGPPDPLADADGGERGWGPATEERDLDGPAGGWIEGDGVAAGHREAGELADAQGERGREQHSLAGGGGEGSGAPELDERSAGRGFWDDVVWLPCRDGKYRPIKPGLQPLAHGVRNRVGILRAAGNAIVPQVAAEFIAAYLQEYP